MSDPDSVMHFECTGRKYAVTFDWNLLMGDVLEELEAHLGDEGVVAWLQRISTTGIRPRDARTRDILAVVFLARAQEEPGVTWLEVARSTAPYTFKAIEEPITTPPAPPVTQVNPLGIPAAQ